MESFGSHVSNKLYKKSVTTTLLLKTEDNTLGMPTFLTTPCRYIFQNRRVRLGELHPTVLEGVHDFVRREVLTFFGPTAQSWKKNLEFVEETVLETTINDSPIGKSEQQPLLWSRR
jgi:hypothetical protein